MDIHIRRNSDGVIRVHHDDSDAWNESLSYMWLDGGNFSCDCNRHLFFQRAENEPDGEDRPCGETAYSIVKIVLPSGEEIEGED